MQHNIHPKSISCVATCSSCGSVYELLGVYEKPKMTVEQCQSCHYAYTGQKRSVKSGAEEKFNSRYTGFDFSKKRK